MSFFFLLFYTITLRVFDFVYTGSRSTYFGGIILVPTISYVPLSRETSTALLQYIYQSSSPRVRFSTAYNIIQRDTISPNFPPLSHPDPVATFRQMPNNTHYIFTNSTVRKT